MPVFSVLCTELSPQARRKMLHGRCNDDFVCCIVECVRNLLKGNVPLSPLQKKKLLSKKKPLRQLILKKTSRVSDANSYRLVVFSGALLGPIISVLGSLFNGAR